jgi:hypothetical protein
MRIEWLGNMFKTVLQFLDRWGDFASSVSAGDVDTEYERGLLQIGTSRCNTRRKGKPTVRYKKLNLCSTTLELSEDFKISRVIG